MKTKLNDISCSLDINTTSDLCNRAKLDTGTYCNYRCSFCYYKNSLDIVDSFDEIKSRIDYLRECGIDDVDLSGGESSIHPNWFDILEYCKGFHISTLSNGYRFSDKSFMKKSVDCGLKEILFSLHGYDERSHDELVGHIGAYEKIIKSIENANDLGVIVRINCTISNHNYMYINSKYVDLINKLNPLEINFIPLNYWDDNGEYEKIDYDIVSPYIKNAIDKLGIKYINVRYIPYCFMVGYERYVCDYYQHIYDIYDWDMSLYDYDVDPTIYKNNKPQLMYDAAKKNRLYSYYKKKECVKCKYFYICDGIEYDMNIHPVKGDYIKDPVYYRELFYADE
jgi:radical SAM protein with 4Fe4S-binding SPASM domain